jgi:hypothetical protein
MNVDFNNLRRYAVDEFNRVVAFLNGSIEKDSRGNRTVLFSVEDFESRIDALRVTLATIALTYAPNNPEMKCVLDEKETLFLFNPERDEEN